MEIAKVPNIKLLLLVCCLLLLTSCRVFVWTFSSEDRRSHGQKAEELAKTGDYDKAIEEYQAHMEARLEESRRPETENPYFYYILIGDIHLKNDKPEKAIESYLTALERKVTPELIADRLEQVAQWYANNKRYQQAIDLLQKHRELDPLIFDSYIDDYHRALVAAEDEASAIRRSRRRN